MEEESVENVGALAPDPALVVALKTFRASLREQNGRDVPHFILIIRENNFQVFTNIEDTHIVRSLELAASAMKSHGEVAIAIHQAQGATKQ